MKAATAPVTQGLTPEMVNRNLEILRKERAAIDHTIQYLETGLETGFPPANGSVIIGGAVTGSTPVTLPASTPRKKLSAEARKKIAAAQKKRWAAKNAGKQPKTMAAGG